MMHLSCPACGAAYEVPEEVLAGGARRLRCARCAHEWVPEVGQAAAPNALPEPAASGIAPPYPNAAPPARTTEADRDDLAMPPPPGPGFSGSGVAGAGVAARAAENDAGRLAPVMPDEAAGHGEGEAVATPPPRLVASPPLIQDRLAPPERDDSAGMVAAAWVASVAILAGLGGAAYFFRDAVQSVWPPSQLVYAALGLS